MSKPMISPPAQNLVLTPDRIDRAQKDPDLTLHNFFHHSQQTFGDLPPSLDGWIGLYLNLQIEGVKADRTTACVQRDLSKFRTFFFQDTQGDDIRRWRQRVTQRFVEYLQKESLRPATITRNLASVRAFAKWVLSIRPDFFPLGNPTQGARPPVQEALRPKGLTDRQMKLLLDAAFDLVSKNYPAQDWTQASGTEQARPHQTIRRPLRDRAIVVLMLNTGLRREEVRNLDLGQLQGRKLVDVKCKGNQLRDLLLGKQTVEIVQEYLSRERAVDAEAFGDSPALFLPSKSRKRGPGEGRLSLQAINQIIATVANEANAHLPATEKFHVHPHRLRHTHAFQLLENDRSLVHVQKRLGHMSQTYLVRYLQVPEEQEQQLLDDMEQC